MNNLEDILIYTKKMTLLYVEDNKEVRETTLVIFQELFAETITAIDGEDGMDKFYNNKIDIVFSDINMPKLNGLDMAKKIIDYDKNIPIFINSAHNESEYFTKAIELNIDAYFLKPLNIDIFLKSLENLIQKIKLQESFNNNLTFLKQYQALTDAYIAVSKTDLEGIITYINPEFCRLSGYTKDELIGQNHNIVRHPENMASVYSDLWYCIKNKKEMWKGILRNKTKSGKIYYADVAIKPILDKDGNIIEYISLRKNITDIMSPKKQLYDFVESAEEPLLVLLKTDDFLDIEKFYGYKLSQEIAERFANNLFELMPKHLGFDKFFIIGNGEYIFAQDIENTNLNFIELLVDDLKMLQRMVNDLKVGIGEIDYDISVIASIANGNGCIENVHYGIKTLEKNKQNLIIANGLSQKEQQEAQNNLKVLKMIKKALDNSKIISYFQPIVDNTTQEIVKYESLVRLIDENNNVISPHFFLDIAKKGKYYSAITNRVLENSFKALNKTIKCITINISALDIEKPSTVEKIFELLESNYANANRIVFELLEDEDVKDIEKITQFISKVKLYGVRIAIDDFGAGYSNFERLLKYQPDILKIDGSLIKHIETDNYSLSVVKTIVSFAKEQNIEMVAEYVENKNIYEILKNLGVEYSQGYYFGKPDLMK